MAEAIQIRTRGLAWLWSLYSLIGSGGSIARLMRQYSLAVEALHLGCGGFTTWLWKLYSLDVEAVSLAVEAVLIGCGGSTAWLCRQHSLAEAALQPSCG